MSMFMEERGLHRGTDVSDERQRGRNEALCLVSEMAQTPTAEAAARRLVREDATRETHQHEPWQVRDYGTGPFCTACGSWNV